MAPRELSGTWTSFTQFTTPNDGHTCSGELLTELQAISRPDNLWSDAWSNMSKAAQRKEKKHWAVEKPELENARRLRGIYQIDPDDMELKNT